MNIRAILDANKHETVLVRAEDTLETAANLLSRNNIGAMPVCDEKRNLIGVVSERDIVRVVAQTPSEIRTLVVADAMTDKVLTCEEESTLLEVMETMNSAFIRHLPVVRDGQLVGMISLRDAMRYSLNEMENERNVLRDIAISR